MASSGGGKLEAETYGAMDEKPAGVSTKEGGEGDGSDMSVFVYSSGLTAAEAEERLAKFGPNCLPEKVTPKWYIFVSLLWQPMPIMIWLAAIIEAAIQNWEDFGILLFIQISTVFKQTLIFFNAEYLFNTSA